MAALADKPVFVVCVIPCRALSNKPASFIAAYVLIPVLIPPIIAPAPCRMYGVELGAGRLAG